MFDAEVAPIFARQHGLITRAQAGHDHVLIRHRLAIGRWLRVAPGVYRLAGVPVTWKQRALAACLDAGSAAVISHRSAAVLFGVSHPGAQEWHGTLDTLNTSDALVDTDLPGLIVVGAVAALAGILSTQDTVQPGETERRASTAK